MTNTISHQKFKKKKYTGRATPTGDNISRCYTPTKDKLHEIINMRESPARVNVRLLIIFIPD